MRLSECDHRPWDQVDKESMNGGLFVGNIFFLKYDRANIVQCLSAAPNLPIYFLKLSMTSK